MNSSSNNKDLHFKGQYGDENVIVFFRPHWITLFPHFLIYGFAALVIFILLLNFLSILLSFFTTPIGQITFVLMTVLFTYFIHSFFNRLINHFLTFIIITDHRIVEIHKSVFLHDVQLSDSIEMIQDVDKEQNGIFKNLLNFGEIIIKMSSSDIRTLRFVPNPNFHFRLINRLHLERVAQRKLHILPVSPSLEQIQLPVQ